MSSINNKRADCEIMDSADNNNRLPPDLWMSQIDPQFSGNLGDPSISDARNINSSAQLDLSMKQKPAYSNYDVPGGSYKQNIQAVTSPMMQPFATSSTRSAWEFASQNFPPSPKNFTTQNLSQPTSNTTLARFSQPASDYTMHMSQSRRMLSSHIKSQSVRDFPPENVSMPGDFMSQNIPQTIRDMQNMSQTVRDVASQNMTQTGSSERSVWAHLYSLDPSLASYNMNLNNTNQKHGYSQEKPYAYTLPHSQSTEASARSQLQLTDNSSILSEKPPLVLGKLNSKSMATSFMNMSSMPSESVSSFAPSLYSNVLGSSHNAKQSQPMDYEEQLGGYSPVSPPTHPSSPIHVGTGGQDTGSVFKHNNFELASTNNVSDMSSNSTLGLPVSQMMHSDPSLLSIPLDVPLDMTKSWSSQDTISITSVTSNYDAQLSQPVVQNTQCNILSKDAKKIVSNIQPTTDSSLPMLPNLSQKIAPKKSNFYGRDASYFSLPDESFQSNYSEKESGNNDNGNTLDSAVSSNYDSANMSFADSLLEANPTQCSNDIDNNVSDNDMTLNSHNNNVNNDIRCQNMEIEENIPLVQMNTEVIDKQGAELSSVGPETFPDQEQADGLKSNLPDNEYESAVNLEHDFNNFANMPNSLINVRGKGARGRKRRGAGAQRRGRGKAAIPTQNVIIESNELAESSGLNESLIDNVGDRLEAKDLNIVNSSIAINPPAVVKSKPARGRKRRGKCVEVDNPDSETAAPRRSSNRRSKDNAMRLIELQAESVYGHLAKPLSPQEPQQPTRTRRKAAKAAIENKLDESKDETNLVEGKDSSSDDMSDEKDVDYAVDEDDEESLKKDELLDAQLNLKKVITERRVGNLKISIKLGSDSSAEIVSSGIDETPIRKKRKVVKKKVGRAKFKSKATIQDDDIEDEDNSKDADEKKSKLESEIPEVESEIKTDDLAVKDEPEEKGDVVKRHNSLMDKYFSSANSATLARQVQKPPKVKKEKLKQEAIQVKSAKNAKSRVSKKSNNSSASGKTSSVSQSNQEDDKASSMDNSSTPDTGLPKFVCGYCPKRYHNKQALLSHMEGHMAEMEDDEDKKPGCVNVNKDPKKQESGTPSKKTESSLGKHATPKAVKKGEVSEESKFNCGECGKTFSSKLKLLDHVRTHTAEKPFECNLCHKCFKERDQLSVHRKVHAQEGLLRCPICSKGFINSGDLNAHVESHPKRSKSGQLPTKQPVPEALKKSSKTAQDGATKLKSAVDLLSEKGNFKGKSFESALDPSSEKNSVKPKSFGSALDPTTEKNSTKPKSFGSALDPFSEKNMSKGKSFSSALEKPSVKNKEPVNTFKKSDGGTTPRSTKEDSSQSVKTAKSFTNVNKMSKEHGKKPPLPITGSDVKKEAKQTKSVDQKPQSDGKTPEENRDKDNKISGECSCQECPECVTRFLQSFE